MGNSKISEKARTLIENPDNEKLLSTASLLEMAIKISLGKLNLTKPFDVLIPQQLNLKA
jgi:PIN domain nuclease of toxin-antitoxin system